MNFCIKSRIKCKIKSVTSSMLSVIVIMLKLIFIFAFIKSCHLWPNHDTSTLQLLQILHRHGDRTPYKFPVNDPYANHTEKYWPAGIGQLTLQGKHRMFKLGQFFRNNYDGFLEMNPRKAYARSSVEHRCIESAASFLAGAFPPGNSYI